MSHIFNETLEKKFRLYHPQLYLNGGDVLYLMPLINSLLIPAIYADACIGNQARFVCWVHWSRRGLRYMRLMLQIPPLQDKNNEVMWEFLMQTTQILLTISKSSIVNNGNGEPIVILYGQYTRQVEEAYSFLILIIQEDGLRLITKPIRCSRVGTPFVCDEDKDGILTIYVGDYDGNVWRLRLRQNFQ